MFLERVIRFFRRRFGSEEKIMPHHGPHAGNIARNKQDLFVVTTKELISHVQQPTRDVNPHKSQVPLQRPAEPAADRERLRPIDQIVLRNFCAKAGKRSKNLQPAAHQHEQRNRIHPMAEPHDERVLVNRFGYLTGFRIFNFDRVAFHLSPPTNRKNANSPGLPSSPLFRARPSLSGWSDTSPVYIQLSSES